MNMIFPGTNLKRSFSLYKQRGFHFHVSSRQSVPTLTSNQTPQLRYIIYIYIASPMECLGMKLHGGASMAYTHHPEPNETWSVWELFLEQRRTPRPVAGHRPKLQKRIDHPCLAYLYTVYIPHRSMRHLFQSEGWPGNRLLPVTSPLNPTSRLSRCGRRKKPSRAYFAGRRD